ncbi:MAG: S9 family peptidase, partial [bacterium]|nr:S9 family peptidase [bacterium]
MRKSFQRCLLVFLILVFIQPAVFAQKKDLAVEDYDQWQSIRTAVLSPDGGWFAYQISLFDGDGWLALTNAAGDNETKMMYGSSPVFSGDNKWFAFAIGVSKKESEKLKKAKKPVKMKMGLVDLTTSEIDTFENITSFSFSDDGRFIALEKYKADGIKTRGADLILRNLETGTNQIIGNIAEHSFNEDGSMLAVLVDSYEKLGNGVHLYDLDKGTIKVLENDDVEFKRMLWDEDGFSLAFMKEIENKDYEDRNFIVYAFKDLDKNPSKSFYNPTSDENFPEGMRISDERVLRWSEDAETVFFGIKEWKKKEKKDDEKDKEKGEDKKKKDDKEELDPPGVDVWHYRDARVQPIQKVRANNDKRFTFLSAWNIESNRFVRLTDEKMRNVTLTGDQKHGIGYDLTPYEPAFREQWNDVYVVDIGSGEKTRILERHRRCYPSPEGKYILYFKDNHWWTYDIDKNTHTNITENISAKFNNYTRIAGIEQDGPFGLGRWAKDDEWVLLYDRYDVYRVWPDGKENERLTNGNDDRIRYRFTVTDYEEDFIDPKAPLYLSVYGDFTKESGYARLDRVNKLTDLIYEPRNISRLRKAEDSDKFMILKQKADESPDYYLCGKDFNDPVKLTDTNPQQDDYYWGHTELITYTNTNGIELQGRLLYPANYQPGKKYPMIVYIYELKSQTLHSYTTPSNRRAYNQRRFSSEGYFVFEPDIVYRLSDPGVSSVECVVPAVEEVLRTGKVDREKIGLMGHSWGAYQTAFLITQTDLFSAAVAGAPLTNMISMYSSVYWNSGTPNATIFETSQGRFPKPYWEDWDKFVENSPVFKMQNTTTPLLVAFGNNDGAVDFNQGVELYNTMRRMEKTYVMLVYEGENHGLAKKENQIDYATRTNEW